MASSSNNTPYYVFCSAFLLELLFLCCIASASRRAALNSLHATCEDLTPFRPLLIKGASLFYIAPLFSREKYWFSFSWCYRGGCWNQGCYSSCCSVVLCQSAPCAVQDQPRDGVSSSGFPARGHSFYTVRYGIIPSHDINPAYIWVLEVTQDWVSWPASSLGSPCLVR